MTKFVTLMNPRPRRAARRARRARMQRNRMGRFTRRRVHSNPRPRRRRRTIMRTVVIRRRRSRRIHRNPSSRHHSPAMRRKIGLAVKRAMAARRHGGGSVARRSVSVIRRSSRRSVSRRGGFGGGSLVSSFKSALSRPLLFKAGGAVGASFAVGFVLRKWGDKLPMANSTYGRCLYTLGVPVTAAFLLRKYNRDLAEGLVIGGLVMTINTLMQGFRASTGAGAPALGAYGVAGELGAGNFGAYPANMVNEGAALGGSNVAFTESAWGAAY